MKLSKRLMVLAGALACSTLAAWGYIHSRKPAAWQTAAVDRGNLVSTISATGNLNAVVTVQVGSQVSGNIKALFADFNTKVRKGQLVALIDPELFQARANQTQAALDSARASVVSAEAGVIKAEADAAQSRANAENMKAGIGKAQVAVLDAKSKLDRRLQLFVQGVVAREDRDTAQATYDTAQAELQAAQAQYQAALQNIAAADAQTKVAGTLLASSRAQVKQAEATLAQAQVDLEHTRILAPVDGTVVARRMDVGQTVAASFQAPTIFEIAQDLAQMQVDTNVDESDVGRVRVGQKANFTVDAYPGVTFPSLVSQIRQAPINTQNVITYDVVVTVPNPDLKLFPGMTANVRILVDRQENVLRVPNAALRYHPADERPAAANTGRRPQKTQAVWILDQSGQARQVPVQLGLSDGNFTSVTGGDLHEGDRVILGSNTIAKSNAAASPARGRGPGF